MKQYQPKRTHVDFNPVQTDFLEAKKIMNRKSIFRLDVIAGNRLIRRDNAKEFGGLYFRGDHFGGSSQTSAYKTQGTLAFSQN